MCNNVLPAATAFTALGPWDRHILSVALGTPEVPVAQRLLVVPKPSDRSSARPATRWVATAVREVHIWVMRWGCPSWSIPQLDLVLEVSGRLAWRTGSLTGMGAGGLQPTDGETGVDHLPEILLQIQLLLLLNQCPWQGLSR